MEVSLMTIELAAKEFAAAKGDVAELVQELNDELEAAKRRRMERLKRLVRVAAAKRDALIGQVETAKHLFKNPRTLMFHGIKCGWRKAKGGLVIEDPERTVALILKHYPEAEAEQLVRTTRKPNKGALEDLSAAELKRLGVQVTEDGDQVVILDALSDVDKVVDALLKGAAEEAKEAA